MEEPMVGPSNSPVTPTTSRQEGVVTVKGARVLDGQGRECTTGGPPQNMSDVEAVEVVADVAEAIPTGLSDLFSDDEEARGGDERYLS